MTCPALESANVSTQRCREAVAALRTCVRLSGTSHGGAERDDCSFGAAICAAQTSHHVEPLLQRHRLALPGLPKRALERVQLVLQLVDVGAPAPDRSRTTH